jgi:hypothetical protein
MRGHVAALGGESVALLPPENGAVGPRQDRAERMVALLAGLARHRESAPQQCLVIKFGKGAVRARRGA